MEYQSRRLCLWMARVLFSTVCVGCVADTFSYFYVFGIHVFGIHNFYMDSIYGESRWGYVRLRETSMYVVS
jgi:hypothetical protein